MHCSDNVWISFHCSLSLHAYVTLTLTLISSGDIIWNKQIHFLAKHDGAAGSGTHPAHPYNLVGICPPVQHQGWFLLFDQPFAVSKMQRGMQGAQGLHIQASGNMDLYMEHPKRKQTYREPIQRASVSPCISFNSYWHSVWFVCSGGSTNSSYQGRTFNIKNTKALALRKST